MCHCFETRHGDSFRDPKDTSLTFIKSSHCDWCIQYEACNRTVCKSSFLFTGKNCQVFCVGCKILHAVHETFVLGHYRQIINKLFFIIEASKCGSRGADFPEKKTFLQNFWVRVLKLKLEVHFRWALARKDLKRFFSRKPKKFTLKQDDLQLIEKSIKFSKYY